MSDKAPDFGESPVASMLVRRDFRAVRRGRRTMRTCVLARELSSFESDVLAVSEFDDSTVALMLVRRRLRFEGSGDTAMGSVVLA